MPKKVKNPPPTNPPPTGVKANQYWQQELGHWETKGRGSGNYFHHNNQRWRLDRKAEAGKPARYSWKSVEAKRGEGRNLNLLREQYLQNTTLDPKASLAFGKGATEPGPIHHAAAAALVGKMHAQFERNLNPNWTPKDGTSDAGKAFVRAMQNRLGLYGGDSPLNLRHYPADNPSIPAVSAVHNRAHTLQRQLGINPEQDLSGYSNTELWRLAQKTAKGVAEIDAQLGYKPKFKSPGHAGAVLRGVQLSDNLNLRYIERDPELESILRGTPQETPNLPLQTPPMTAPTDLEGQTGGFVTDTKLPEIQPEPKENLSPQVMETNGNGNGAPYVNGNGKDVLHPLDPLKTTAAVAYQAYRLIPKLINTGVGIGFTLTRLDRLTKALE